ncbi:MMPL family transporter [Lentibacillus amyloliquefaciens]|uniref:MMPL domain-containing protein n=1 Tax=Lentibacillus amyloliquefaciens TaxID=1472767 RepID=A0A0U3W7F6_9BACI|nr:MMPL family transporter [Lentibacillus amyloliquefaciens]ALX49088.1 MMPL domain-containing protein [Lentibacillus amyloliquefaciens]
MNRLLQTITDRVTTKKGMWITLSIWLLGTLLLAVFAPSARDYQVTSIESIPDDAQSMIAQDKIDNYFGENNDIQGIMVFQPDNMEAGLAGIPSFLEKIEQENINGLTGVVPLGDLTPQASTQFFSDDGTTAMIPFTLDSSLESGEMKDSIDAIYDLQENEEVTMKITGPAAIGADTTELFSRADIVLIMSTVGIILVLLVVIYRSPFLALIPLLGAAFVYEAVNQILGLMGKAGLQIGQQSFSIMTILLFAALIDYSLFVFSRYREELKQHENKYEAMKRAMRGTGVPIFYSGGTVIAAMLVLFFAEFAEYRNFAPIFGTAVAVVLIASLTLVPAMFTLFGRKSFWPKVPQVGDEQVKSSSLWSKVGKFVTREPVNSVAIIGILLVGAAANVFNLDYEFNTMKSFPDDMPSREGYEMLEEKFEPGDLAPTTVLFESNEALSNEKRQTLADNLSEQQLVESVQVQNMTDDQEVISYQMTFDENPYSGETMNALKSIISDSGSILDSSNLDGDLYFAGETATSVDDRSLNNRDLTVIVILETVLIFGMLIFLTRSFKMPLYMMGTILVSFLAALGLGTFLTELFFGIETVSNRVPFYSFVFLVALGIDYNIMLVSRFMEEREKYPVKTAVEKAVANTGGVISSAGIILAATFSVLMTQPIQLLFVFGFIVAVGILMDTFLIRGVLLPGLLVLFEKDKKQND